MATTAATSDGTLVHEDNLSTTVSESRTATNKSVEGIATETQSQTSAEAPATISKRVSTMANEIRRSVGGWVSGTSALKEGSSDASGKQLEMITTAETKTKATSRLSIPGFQKLRKEIGSMFDGLEYTISL
ncbi:hypothetical protein HK100_002382 [Physocladia obscura]|uniref:Uncharacterized protein n=1 Tax=Physocladia obscura TaxID=109957 RepID=A0AAD5SVG2_9FUNG|nr:hypothetical protein HK100_002382 [Physocladia obscura]